MTFGSQLPDARKPKLMDELRKEFTEHGWSRIGTHLEDTLDVIQSDPQACEALKVLTKAGCNLAVLLQEIYLYCGGASEDIKIWRKQVRYTMNQLQAISTRLAHDANIVAKIAKEDLDDEYEPYASAFRIPAHLQEQAKTLAEVRAALGRHTHGKTGRNKHLVFLSYHVKAATNHEYYQQIARVVASVRGSTAYNVIQLADAIRKTIKRCEKGDKLFFQTENRDIVHHIAQWRHRRMPDAR